MLRDEAAASFRVLMLGAAQAASDQGGLNPLTCLLGCTYILQVHVNET